MRHPVEIAVCDTTPVRYFAITGQFDLLARVLGGTVQVPRQVLDPAENADGVEALLSELGRSERYWAKRSRDPDAMDCYSRLRALRARSDIRVVDLDPEEELAFAEMIGPSFLRSFGRLGRLGAGEAAVIALVEARGWAAIMDDGAARDVLQHRSPGAIVSTTRDVLRRAVGEELVDSAEATLIYADMLAKGYRGPEDLWS